MLEGGGFYNNVGEKGELMCIRTSNMQFSEVALSPDNRCTSEVKLPLNDLIGKARL